jgi:hypothetical protein
MSNLSKRRSISQAAVVALGSLGITGSAVLISAQAAADPNVPNDVWLQCSVFTGPAAQQNQAATDQLAGCSSRSGDGGSGTISRPANGGGSETLQFSQPFEGGKSIQLTGTTSKVVAGAPGLPASTVCPADHPVEVQVSATVAPRQPYAGSPVSATICTNGRDFIEAPGTFFTIQKVPGSPGDVNPGS